VYSLSAIIAAPIVANAEKILIVIVKDSLSVSFTLLCEYNNRKKKNTIVQIATIDPIKVIMNCLYSDFIN
uniref:hypothetical protein n=1 Tax=Acinetobacter baumannii TaxID=470 RepID=UPI001BC88329